MTEPIVVGIDGSGRSLRALVWAATGHRRAVVGADGSPHSTAALDYAFPAASLRKARLLIVHAWSMPYPPEPPVLIDPGPDEIARKHQQELEEQIRDLRKRYPEVEVSEDPVRDAPIPALTRASDRADLLVLGSRAAAASTAWPWAPSATTSFTSRHAPWPSSGRAPSQPQTERHSRGHRGAEYPVRARPAGLRRHIR
ncbi:universal stress protein [Streptomyces antibioticus]|uniref:universal stress protein n=1 Tax=Streptomyces antibioticus TaxID=1890 RepID=UPI0033E86B42